MMFLMNYLQNLGSMAKRKLTKNELHRLILEATKGASDVDVIEKSITLDLAAADALIVPYKTKYLFHTQNLRGTAAIAIFDLKQLYELTPQKAILKGDVTFNYEPLYSGRIIIDFIRNTVQHPYKGERYTLLIDPSKRDVWNSLINELHRISNPVE